MENNTNEIWKDVVGYEGLYQVSSFGNIKSFRSKTIGGKLLKKQKDLNGYFMVGLYRKNKKMKMSKIHRLMCFAFLKNPLSKPHVNHINGIKGDNRIENLEWYTRSENIRHAIDTGLMKPMTGEKNGRSKITTQDVKYIRENYKRGNGHLLAKQFSISSNAISKIAHGIFWKDSDVNETIKQKNKMLDMKKSIITTSIQIKCTQEEKKLFMIEATKNKFKTMSAYGRELLNIDGIKLRT